MSGVHPKNQNTPEKSNLGCAPEKKPYTQISGVHPRQAPEKTTKQPGKADFLVKIKPDQKQYKEQGPGITRQPKEGARASPIPTQMYKQDTKIT